MKNKLLITVCLKRLVVLFVLWLNTTKMQAQIIYTDIEPDFIIENTADFYELDLNNDGIVDFTLNATSDNHWISAEADLNTNGVNAFPCVGAPFGLYVIALNLKSIISDNYCNFFYDPGWTYLGAEYCDLNPSYCNYSWGGGNDKYLGLRFLLNGQTHYGWARLDVKSDNQWVIKDYAYNATPNEPIIAGQMILGLEELDFKETKILVSNGILTVFNLPNRTTYNLYTINGQEILHGYLDQTNNNIDIQNLTYGLYFIELITKDSNSATTKKFIIP